MVAALIVASPIDVAIAFLLTAVSGFILEGVNNTGPQMPGAVLLVAFVAFCIVAPVTAWMMRSRGYRPTIVLGLAFAPSVIAVLAWLLEPLLA